MNFSTLLVLISLVSSLVSAAPRSSQHSRRQSTGFAVSNGQQAQAQNQKFATLSASDACNHGDLGCIGGAFAQCNFGSWVTTPCGAGTTCAALPLLLKPGTSIACTTAADRDSRIANALAGLGPDAPFNSGAGNTNNSGNTNNGNNNNNSRNQQQQQPQPPAATASSKDQSNNFQVDNGRLAQAENSQFALLNSGSRCSDGQNACIGTSFAQCVGGKFVLTKCSANLICASLPLVKKPGTSIACTTEEDRDRRIQDALNA